MFNLLTVCFYFSSFEAGVANDISSFKWQKNIYIHEKKDISNIEVLDYLSIYQNLFFKFSDIDLEGIYIRA